MKYAFAACLVILALVFVFHTEQLLPIPRALGGLLTSSLASYAPFGVKAAYAESCIAGLEAKQHRVQYALSESAVRLEELDRQVGSWRRQLDGSVARLRVLMDRVPEAPPDSVGLEVQRHDNLEDKITQALAFRSRLADTIKSLDDAEGKASHKIVELRNRLETVTLDHERNNAQDMATEMQVGSISARAPWTSPAASTLQALERQERIREEWRRRYGAEQLQDTGTPKQDPMIRAREILKQAG